MDGAIRALAAAAAVSLGALAAGCGSDDSGEDVSTAPGQNEPVGSASESSPFRVGHEPTGYRLVRAGQGTYSQEWGADSFGTDEPVTVLAPPGEGPGGPGEVRVSVTGFEGYQGGLAQASTGYLDEDQREDFELDGRPAIYMPAHEDDGESEPADLVAQVGDDLAVRVSAADATRDELENIVGAVEPQDDHLLAPLVPEPPGDLQVVGSADADVAMSLLASPYPASESVPSGERAHTAVWARGEESDAWSPDETVVVTTLPGTALDLDAVNASLPSYRVEGGTITETEVAGRPAVVLDVAAQESGHNALRAVITSTADGDLLLVIAHNSEQPEIDELTEVAASVEIAEAQEWDDLVLAARGGPGLHPDPGAVELERGTFGDTDWLFQARVDDGSMTGSFSSEEDTTGQYLADSCLKLSTDERICASSNSSDGAGHLLVDVSDPYSGSDGEEPELPGFVVVTTTGTATTARLHVDDTEVLDATLHPLPDDQRRAGIFMGLGAHDWYIPDCIDPGEPVEPGTIELLDESDQPLPCAT